MDWRIDLIRKSHMRLLAKKAAGIEAQQAQAKTARADERKHIEEQKQTKVYILAILMKQSPAAAHATA
jgi:hypothetical protein